MSGICGVINLDGAPVDRDMLTRLTRFMTFRGPDSQTVWIGNEAGLGCALLRSTNDPTPSAQPYSRDGRLWIVADARIDGQAALREKLRGHAGNDEGLADADDADLILRSYRVWGEECTGHLIGDFAFAIWDAPNKRLFCARDHFGVKPFFYAYRESCFIFSNTLDCLRHHPAVRSTLNDTVVADFLLFEASQDRSASIFNDIRRLPSAHQLTLANRSLQIDCYWKLPNHSEIRYRATDDYAEHFKELLETAVADRMRSVPIAISMSGGLDSTAIAATASAVTSRQHRKSELHAYAVVYDRLFPDSERNYATLAARALNIPIDYCVADDYRLFAQFESGARGFPEPLHEPDGAVYGDALRLPATQHRAMLTGWDGDALLDESPKPYFRHLLREGQFGRALGGILGYAISQRRILPLDIRNRLFGSGQARRPAPQYPPWLNPSFERRLELKERWEQIARATPKRHSLRPYAHHAFTFLTQGSNFFERYDPGVTGLALECRHPLIDLRLLDFCLAIPPMPWCVKKEIMRRAMKGHLPEPVRLRPKTALAGFPVEHMLRQSGARWVDDFIAAPELDSYIVRDKIPSIFASASSEHAWVNLRPLSLNIWMQNLPSQPAPSKESV
jgi:asparagine synthase (glutamine-hydrolysing)